MTRAVLLALALAASPARAQDAAARQAEAVRDARARLATGDTLGALAAVRAVQEREGNTAGLETVRLTAERTGAGLRRYPPPARRRLVVRTARRLLRLDPASPLALETLADDALATVLFFRDRGARISEFPMNRRTADFARAGGDAIVLGGPNAARGGSHLGSVGAADMIRAGLCDILASDYYYPAMLAAIARLRADHVGSLAALWPLISANPARASGLMDRGQIAQGLRADLVVMDWPDCGLPAIRQTWVAGRCAYAAIPQGCGPGV